MPRLLAEALERRGRTWGADNDRVLRLLRACKLPCRSFPSRPQQWVPGGFITRIPPR